MIKKGNAFMADIHALFMSFNDSITLSNSKTSSLRTSRDSLRKGIKEWFSDNDKQKPKFCWQGSFAMKTTVNPVGGSDYDIDDGVYLSGYSDTNSSDWPSTTTVHTWVKNAVTGQTKADPINKDTCIRVVYASDYHIDLPIYIEQNGSMYLAHKNKGWMISDPKAFRDWFVQKVNDNDEQLRRFVKYLKAWKDYKSVPLKGIEITILVSNNYCVFEGHDEKSLRDTVQAIIDSLEINFACYKPVAPYENLFDGCSKTKKDNILNALKALKQALDNAINVEDPLTASNYMIDEFGSRFPKGEALEQTGAKTAYARTDAPGVLKHDGRSA